MPTILLEQIIELLTGWKDSFFTWANAIGDKIASIKTNTDSLPDIKDNTDDIKDNTAAVITPISNINTNVSSISSDTASIRTDTGIIKNNAQAIATSSGQAAAFAQDVANNTLEVKNKITTIASDTTQMRADSAVIINDINNINNLLMWVLYGIDYIETDDGASPLSFTTDKTDNIIRIKSDIIAQGGDGTPTDPISIIGYSSTTLNINNSPITISFGQTVYDGYLIQDEAGHRAITLTTKAITFDSNSNWLVEDAGALKGPNFYTDVISDAKSYQTANSKAKCNCSPFTNSAVTNKDTCYISASKRFNFTWGLTLGCSTVAEFKDYLNNNNLEIVVCYELETPITINLTDGTPISTNEGSNIITNDTYGNLSVTYKESVKHYLEKQ